MLLVQGAIALCRSAVAVVALPALSVIAAGISILHLTYARLIASKLIGQYLTNNSLPDSLHSLLLNWHC